VPHPSESLHSLARELRLELNRNSILTLFFSRLDCSVPDYTASDPRYLTLYPNLLPQPLTRKCYYSTESKEVFSVDSISKVDPPDEPPGGESELAARPRSKLGCSAGGEGRGIGLDHV